MGWNTRPTYGDCEPIRPQLPSINDARSAYTTPALPASRRLVMPQRVPPPILGVNSSLGGFMLGGHGGPDPSAAFLRPSGLIAGTLGEEGQIAYVDALTPDDAIGDFSIGESVIGQPMPLYHGQIEDDVP